jgi:ribonucleotide monophosphatase NagD (HAD superfamily)
MRHHRDVAWILDLDGVIWLAGEAIPGAADAVARLRAAGERVCFATNNSSQRLADQEAKLASFGIPAEGDVLTSAMAAALLLQPGDTALVCGGPGVEEALERRGVRTIR